MVNVPPVFDTLSLCCRSSLPYEPVVLVRYWYFVMFDVPWAVKTTVASMDWSFAASVRVGLPGGRIRVTDVADTAAMPLPGTSVTASTASATVTVGDRDPITSAAGNRVSLRPCSRSIDSAVVRLSVVAPSFTVILVRVDRRRCSR